MRIQVDAIDLRQRYGASFVPSFRSAFDQWIAIVVSASYHDRNFFGLGYYFNQCLHLFVDSMHGMTIGFEFFLFCFSRCVNQVLDVPEIKMPNKQHFTTIEEIIALNVEKLLQKRKPYGICAASPFIPFYADVFRDTKQYKFCGCCLQD